MTRCPHASTTVMLHLFGEAPPSYAAHLAGCPQCQEALAEHVDTVAVVAPALKQAAAQRPWRPPSWGLGAALALAAGLALTLLPAPTPGPTPAPAVALAVAPDALDLTWYDPLSTELAWLEEDIAALSVSPLPADLEIP